MSSNVRRALIASVAALLAAGLAVPQTGAAADTASPVSFWTTQTPQVPAVSDTQAVELGLRFSSDVNGAVSGVRFYKGPGNTGRHTGSLWTSSGTRLATATFMNETASGWQTVRFSKPVPVKAGSTYVASYHTAVGRYAADHYFFAQPQEAGPLNAPSGGNGVYRYGSGGFPNKSYRSSNYYVDVLFTAAQTAAPTTPTTVSLWSDETPQVPASVDTQAVELGLRFTSDVPGSVSGVRFYKGEGNTGPHTGSLWSSSGTRLATAAFAGETASGWQTVRFSTPVPLAAHQTYIVSYHTTVGRYAEDEGYFSSPRHVGPLHAPGGSNGVYRYGSGGFPDQSYRSTNYYVDVLFTPSQQTTAPTPSAPATPAPSPSPSPTPAPSTSGAFPVGVWLQDPDQHADDFKSFGVNTFVGLWNWPNDSQAYPGWAQNSLDALAREGMTAFAGESATAVTNTLQMRNNDRVTGWLGGDEPDMFGPAPAEWTREIASLTAVQDRPVYANFGKGFGGHDWWYDHISDADRAAWCAPVDIASVDYYGMTDYYEPAKNRGAWTYGRAIDNLEKACPGKPTWSFVEVTQPWDGSPNAATAAGIRAAAWNAVIHGADGIEWFVHDFYCDTECGSAAFLTAPRWAANRQAVTDLGAELQSYSAALTSPDVHGVTSSTGVPLALLTKRVGGTTYVFAQADGSYTAPQGHSGTATVTVDGRSFTDTWAPYQVRVYTIQ